MKARRTLRLRALTAAVIAGLATVGLVTTGAGAQAAAVPGVTDKTVSLGYLSSVTGPAASVGKGTDKGCEARIDAQNAKGGVNGRKIDLQAIDDQTANNTSDAHDLIENRKVFAVINNSPLAFLSYKYIRDAGVPQIGNGADGVYYYDKGNESVVSALGNAVPVPGLTFDNTVAVVKKYGATKVAAVGYGNSPSSAAAARDTVKWAAPSVGVKGVYANTSLSFGASDVGAVVLGIKNSGANSAILLMDSDTNIAIVQGLQQNGVKMKAVVLATGYSQDLLSQPAAKTLGPTDLLTSTYRPIETGGSAVKEFQANLKKYAQITGVPSYGAYTGYIICDMAIQGLLGAGKTLTRQGFVDGLRGLGRYNGAGLSCKPITLGLKDFGKIDPTACAWFVTVKNGKFVVANNGKPVFGKLAGSKALLAQWLNKNYAANANAK